MTRLLTLILLIITLLPGRLSAADDIYVEYLDNRNGLPDNTVRSIFQDSKGFIWMSTLNGVSRYDGYSFTNYAPLPGKDLSLADRRVKGIREDGHGYLWFTTGADMVSCFSLKENRFVDFTGCGAYRSNYSYIEIYPDAVWLYGRHGGVMRITWRDGRFISEKFTKQNGRLKSDAINFVRRDNAGNVWIGASKGLYRYTRGRIVTVDGRNRYTSAFVDKGNISAFLTDTGQLMVSDGHRITMKANLGIDRDKEKTTAWIRVKNDWIIFTDRRALRIDRTTFRTGVAEGELNVRYGIAFTDARGIYWISGRNSRLLMVSPEKGLLKTFQTTMPWQLQYNDNERYRVVYDRRGVIWIASNVSGLFSYNPDNGAFTHYDESDRRYPLVTSNAVLSLFLDRSGGLWVGSGNTGVAHFSFVDNRPGYFYVADPASISNEIRTACRLADGTVYLGGRDGWLYAYDGMLAGCYQRQRYNKNIYAVAVDRQGQIWKASRGEGVFVGDRQYRRNGADKQSLSSNQAFCLLCDNGGRMWIGTLGGGLDLAVSDGRGGYRFRHFLTEGYAQSSIRTLMQDRQGWIWVGTSNGVYLFQPQQMLKDGRMLHFLPNSEIKQIIEDSRGNVYLSENGIGIAVSRSGRQYNHLTFEHYGIEQGLLNAMVQAMVEDRQGRIWLTTGNGVSCFNLKNRTFDSYVFSTDIKRNVYNETAAFRLNDGRLAFGTNYGLQIINPSQMRGTADNSTVVFTGLKLNGIEESPLTQSLAYTREINLGYDQNSFAVSFSTLTYPISYKPQYSYFLDNYDHHWSAPSTLNFAAYKNLSPGTYTLHVKVRNAGGLWSGESVLTIVVEPPFWMTTWAYLLYVLLAAAAVYAAWRIARNMNDLRNKVEVERQLTDYKLVFFTNISHEFRTPLTLIQAALDRLRRASLPSDEAASVKLMARSSNRMMRLVNQLIDFRKMEKGKLKPSLEKADAIAFVKDITRSFNDRARTKDMQFRFHCDEPSFNMFIDKDKLDKIVSNLLSNAFKYTPSGGSITCDVRLDKEKKLFVVTVTDSGVGIPKEKQKELFGRFMQSSFSSNSMGIGLHLTAELVHVLKGTISYHDNPGGGSVFVVSLPADESVYGHEDFLTAGSVLLEEEDRQRQEIMDIADESAAGDDTADAGSGARPLPEPPMNKRSLLVIEDDDDVRELLKNELSVYFDTTACPDGQSGIAYAMEHDVDLIVCDVMMPGMTGFEVTRKLKQNFPTSHIPIILLTALGDSDNYQAGIDSGADAYVTKPFSVNLLLSRISHLIEQRDKLKEKFSRDPVSVRPIISTTDEDKKFADRLMEIIEAHLKDADYSADDFASDMALGRTVFYKKVKGVTGYGPKEYMRIIRMKKAAQMLLNPDISISEVAFGVGMNDPFYFSRCFKNQFGLSPSAYQKQGGVIEDNSQNK